MVMQLHYLTSSCSSTDTPTKISKQTIEPLYYIWFSESCFCPPPPPTILVNPTHRTIEKYCNWLTIECCVRNTIHRSTPFNPSLHPIRFVKKKKIPLPLLHTFGLYANVLSSHHHHHSSPCKIYLQNAYLTGNDSDGQKLFPLDKSQITKKKKKEFGY